MVDVICERLRKNNKQCNVVSLGIGYSKTYGGGFYHRIKLDSPTDDNKEIKDICSIIFDRYYTNTPIRKVTIACGSLIPKVGVQLNIFETIEDTLEKDELNKTIDEIKSRFGKNSLLKASSLLPDSTAIERNKKVGGHNAD